ncbi:uncharacterized protein PITG_07004 [Phytophthora infestans T30-4]|uniref:Uncharacterized protein n=1 Tax=Phytophthora infestans (strain T30-4) TaxID=403677 RepID=D0N705_PHYIT|nr:uncharacterized protein PITG_07004 [Phytophthora infestans T30-4]EEY53354.1 conserved hypothetical protein [Phytophthora infestans T30-4]|eukprot:XP_002904972.1 conserved hypothetical protein [Phytophthora infestans T30-4]
MRMTYLLAASFSQNDSGRLLFTASRREDHGNGSVGVGSERKENESAEISRFGNKTTGKETGFKEVFAGIVERGGSVSILAWANIGVGYTSYILKARDAINSITPSPINGAKAVFIFDDRLPKALSSHHQKNMTTPAATLGKQSVQIVRTFSCLYDHYEEFAPRGETSLFQAHIKAIQNAKNFIY